MPDEFFGDSYRPGKYSPSTAGRAFTYVKQHPGATIRQTAEALRRAYSTTHRAMRHLEHWNAVRREWKDRAYRWYLRPKEEWGR